MSKMDMGINFSKIEKFDINRRVIAHSTHKAWSEVPHVSYVFEPDVTDFIDFFQKHREELSSKGKISINTVMMKVISEGLKASPALNSLLYYNPKNKVGLQKFSSDINIALPWLLEDGRMITPIVKNVESKNLFEITAYIDDIARRIKNTDIDAMQYKVGLEETLSDISHFKFKVVRQVIAAKIGKNKLLKPTKKQKKAYNAVPDCDKITPADIFGASILISNIGSMFKNQRGSLSLLEIITPQVFVIGINAIQERPAVVTKADGTKEIAIRNIMPITLTWDHRAADTANILPFQAKLDEYFEKPELIKEWV